MPPKLASSTHKPKDQVTHLQAPPRLHVACNSHHTSRLEPQNPYPTFMSLQLHPLMNLFVTQTVGHESFKFHPQPWGPGGILWWNYHYPQRHTGNNHHGSLVTEAPTALTLCRYPVVIGSVPKHKAPPNHGLTSFWAVPLCSRVMMGGSKSINRSTIRLSLPVCCVTYQAVPIHVVCR